MPVQLTPVATPVIRHSAVARQDTQLLQFAEALKDVNPTLIQLMERRSEFDKAQNQAKAIEDRRKNNIRSQEQWKKLVADGVIQSNDNVWYQTQMETEIGREEIRQATLDFWQHYQDNPQLYNGGPELIQQEIDKRLKPILATKSGLALAGMDEDIQRAESWLVDAHMRERGVRVRHDRHATAQRDLAVAYRSGGLAAFLAKVAEKQATLPNEELNSIIDDAAKDAAREVKDASVYRTILTSVKTNKGANTLFDNKVAELEVLDNEITNHQLNQQRIADEQRRRTRQKTVGDLIVRQLKFQKDHPGEEMPLDITTLDGETAQDWIAGNAALQQQLRTLKQGAEADRIRQQLRDRGDGTNYVKLRTWAAIDAPQMLPTIDLIESQAKGAVYAASDDQNTVLDLKLRLISGTLTPNDIRLNQDKLTENTYAGLISSYVNNIGDAGASKGPELIQLHANLAQEVADTLMTGKTYEKLLAAQATGGLPVHDRIKQAQERLTGQLTDAIWNFRQERLLANKPPTREEIRTFAEQKKDELFRAWSGDATKSLHETAKAEETDKPAPKDPESNPHADLAKTVEELPVAQYGADPRMRLFSVVAQSPTVKNLLQTESRPAWSLLGITFRTPGPFYNLQDQELLNLIHGKDNPIFELRDTIRTFADAGQDMTPEVEERLVAKGREAVVQAEKKFENAGGAQELLRLISERPTIREPFTSTNIYSENGVNVRRWMDDEGKMHSAPTGAPERLPLDAQTRLDANRTNILVGVMRMANIARMRWAFGYSTDEVKGMGKEAPFTLPMYVSMAELERKGEANAAALGLEDEEKNRYLREQAAMIRWRKYVNEGRKLQFGAAPEEPTKK